MKTNKQLRSLTDLTFMFLHFLSSTIESLSLRVIFSTFCNTYVTLQSPKVKPDQKHSTSYVTEILMRFPAG